VPDERGTKGTEPHQRTLRNLIVFPPTDRRVLRLKLYPSIVKYPVVARRLKTQGAKAVQSKDQLKDKVAPYLDLSTKTGVIQEESVPPSACHFSNNLCRVDPRSASDKL
jgi:hypothetical protein